MENLFQEKTYNKVNHNVQKKQTSFFSGATIQRKLTIGSENDSYEVEADRVADQVVGMSDTQIQTRSQTNALIQRKCAACEEEKVQKKSLAESITPMIQRKTTTKTGESTASNNITNQINSSKGGGNAMDTSTSNYMGSRFGVDFSGVRIHTGSQAIQMSKELNAQAFTVGNDIYFNEGKYNPNDNSGKHLLAHELTHTLQQTKDNIQPRIQRMLTCPSHLDSDENTPSGWKSYFGDSCTFHCCFRGILEDRTASPSDPQNECFYDDSGNLVDANHEYAGCGGTPNDYDSSSSPISHTFRDSGGIWEAGWSAYWEAHRFSNDRSLVMAIGTTSRTPAEPHLGRSSRTVKTGAVWVTIGNQTVLVVASEIAGSRRLNFKGWVNNYFRNLALERANRIQGSIPVIPSSTITGIPSSFPNSTVTR